MTETMMLNKLTAILNDGGSSVVLKTDFNNLIAELCGDIAKKESGKADEKNLVDLVKRTIKENPLFNSIYKTENSDKMFVTNSYYAVLFPDIKALEYQVKEADAGVKNLINICFNNSETMEEIDFQFDYEKYKEKLTELKIINASIKKKYLKKKIAVKIGGCYYNAEYIINILKSIPDPLFLHSDSDKTLKNLTIKNSSVSALICPVHVRDTDTLFAII